jgi:hypothetical protein
VASERAARIYGIDDPREWIIVRGRQDSRDFRLAMTKRYFLDDIWTALVAAGAVPASALPAPRTARNGPAGHRIWRPRPRRGEHTNSAHRLTIEATVQL